MISFGYYFNAALGFNGLTLKVLGKLRYIVTINIIAVIVNVGINLLLIPKYGALGAAIGTGGTMVVHNIFKQIGLRLTSGISIFDRQYLPFYLIIAGVGPGHFSQYYARKYGNEVGVKYLRSNRRAHNLYIEMIANLGLIGISSFMAITLFMFYRLWQARRRFLENRPDLAKLATALILAICAYLGSAIIGSPWRWQARRCKFLPPKLRPALLLPASKHRLMNRRPAWRLKKC